LLARGKCVFYQATTIAGGVKFKKVEEKMKGEGWGIDRFIGAKKMR